jgi:hypothetical protein
MAYDIHTNKTTPYWNCPTLVLEKKVDDINEMIKIVNTIPGDHLGYTEAHRLEAMLKELRASVVNQIEYRKQLITKE